MKTNYNKPPKIINNIDSDKNLSILQVLDKYTNLYINSKISCNLAENSIYSIKTTLERFYDFVADESDENTQLTIFDINKYFLSNYLNKLSGDNLHPSSQKLHLTIIKNFFYFMADNDINQYGILRVNISGIKIKTEQKEKDSFSQNDQRLILLHLDKLDATNTFLAQRNSLLIKILMSTGIRISELINLKWENITESEDNNQEIIYNLLVKGKGNKERYTYIPYNLIASNLEFLLTKPKDSDYVFNTSKGSICNRSSLYIIVDHLLTKAGISKSGLHIFRHTFARSLVDKDVNLSTIKDLLGHSNISITAQFYAKSNENAKRNALMKLNK